MSTIKSNTEEYATRIRSYRRRLSIESAKRWRGPRQQAEVKAPGDAIPVGAETRERLAKFQARESLRVAISSPAYRTSRAAVERIIGSTIDFVDLPPNEQALKAGRPVARLVTVPRAGIEPEGFATGFLVAPNVLLTNQHVFRTAGEADGTAAQFLYEKVSGGVRNGLLFELDPSAFFVNDEPLDYALVGVTPRALDGAPLDQFQFLPLIAQEGKIKKGDPVNIIQHPEGRPKQYATVNNQLLDLLTGGFLVYETDTLEGSSGALVTNQFWEVIGLHHCGVPRMQGNKLVTRHRGLVDVEEEVDDSELYWIANEGIRVSAIVTSLEAKRLADPVQQKILAGLLDSSAIDPLRMVAEQSPLISGRDAATEVSTMKAEAAQNVFHFHSPVTIQFFQAAGATAVSTPEVVTNGAVTVVETPGQFIEKKLVFDEDYSNRTELGYQEDFLPNQRIPLPAVVAQRQNEILTDDNGEPWAIPYYHFALAMNRPRRLVMWTAANVDYTPDLRGQKTRKQYGGEDWRLDPRVAERAPGLQIEDVDFYKPATRIDRGHIVRREDNVWGDTEEIATFANSDTYHWTNCTPQHMAFNQSGRDGIWGQFEEHIQSAVQAEGGRMVVLAGPVLAENDPEKGYTRGTIQVPMRYWKVVACVSRERNRAKLFAYGFIFDQSEPIARLGYERMNMTDYEVHQHSLSFVTQESGVVFPDILMRADVMRSRGGEEGIRRPVRINTLADLVLA